MDNRTYMSNIGQPKGIPEEYKAMNEVTAGLQSIFLWVTINKNVEWINYIYFNQQRFINHTDDALAELGEQLDATTRTARENRIILDWMLAKEGGVCAIIGDTCCTYIPHNTAPEGSFTLAIRKLRGLRLELKNHSGQNPPPKLPGLSIFGDISQWLRSKLGSIGAALVTTIVSVIMGLFVVALIVCCAVPCLGQACSKMIARQLILTAKEPDITELIDDEGEWPHHELYDYLA